MVEERFLILCAWRIVNNILGTADLDD